MSSSKELIGYLGQAHPDLDVLTDAADRAGYETGARYGAGTAAAVVRPATREQVQVVVAAAQRFGVRLVTQGANTGLVGASTPDAGGEQIVLSTARLKGAIAVDPLNQSVTVGAGVLLSELNTRLAQDGLFFPVDLGADPTIGGMIAANTGGARLLKYGDVRQNLLGVEAVLAEPAGELLDLNRALRKNNVGFDFKQLFVGTGGAFGVVTAATLRVYPLPAQTATALLVPSGVAELEALLLALNAELGDFLSSCEGISREAAQAVVRHLDDVEDPFAEMEGADYAMLVELSSTMPSRAGGLDLEALLMDFLERHYGTLIGNAVVGKPEALWRLRHSITESIRHEGKIIALDLSVPRSRFPAFRAEARALIAARYPWLRIYDFGHLGDGGVHLNMVWPQQDAPAYDEAVAGEVRAQLYRMTVERFGGSFSAEHGIGPYNERFYRDFTADAVLDHIGAMQSRLDPRRTLSRLWLGNGE